MTLLKQTLIYYRTIGSAQDPFCQKIFNKNAEYIFQQQQQAQDNECFVISIIIVHQHHPSIHF
jgi:hypothetical protein